MKVFIVLSLAAVAFASLEPAGYRPPGSSLSTRYLPANQHSSSAIGAPSNQYLPASFSGPASHTASHLGASSHYGAPSNQYLPAAQYNSPAAAAPSNTYLPASQYNAPVATPSNTYLPANTYGAPTSQYSGHGHSSSSSSRYSGVPSTSYGTPVAQYASPVSAPTNHYLPANTNSYHANSGYRYAAPEESVPAKYNFEYEVKDESSGNDFGHMETRDGDKAQGVYTVLLPDGRKQIVHYDADEEGYKPRISYEETRQAYNHHAHQGYPQGPY